MSVRLAALPARGGTAPSRSHAALIGVGLLALLVAALAVATLARQGTRPGDAVVLRAATNTARAEEGLKPLAVDARLSRAARDYAAALASSGRFEHTDIRGSTVVDRAEAVGYASWAFLGENLARTADGVPLEHVVAAWLNSESHRANLLSAEASEMGAGCVRRDGAIWCVQLFGRSAP